MESPKAAKRGEEDPISRHLPQKRTVEKPSAIFQTVSPRTSVNRGPAKLGALPPFTPALGIGGAL
jgi:hypothetical protein